ncbi:hypothetical protein ACWOBX_08355 [Facklamia languida]
MPIINFNGADKVVLGSESDKVYLGNELVWEGLQEITLNSVATMKSYYVDATEDSRTKFQYQGIYLYLQPQPGSFAPYLALKLDQPINKGDKFITGAQVEANLPSTHKLQMELGNQLIWTESSRSWIGSLTKGYDGVYRNVFMDTYTGSEPANYLYLTMRGSEPIGNDSPYMKFKHGNLNIFNLTKDGLDIPSFDESLIGQILTLDEPKNKSVVITKRGSKLDVKETIKFESNQKVATLTSSYNAYSTDDFIIHNTMPSEIKKQNIILVELGGIVTFGNSDIDGISSSAITFVKPIGRDIPKGTEIKIYYTLE